MRNIGLLIIICCITMVSGGCVVALNAADQSFEKARHLRLRGSDDAAQPRYAAAAQDYEQVFAEDGKEGKTPFLSSRIKAGMSFYWSGQTQKAYDMFKSLYDAKDRELETLAYGGLAAAQLGKQQEAITMWSDLDATHDMYILLQGVKKALSGLDDGSMTLQQAHDTVQNALWQQDRRNVVQKMTPSSMQSPQDNCSGRFWWRYNDSTCSGDIRPVRGF